MRIGLDIASLAFKGQVDQIVLIAGTLTLSPQRSSLDARDCVALPTESATLGAT